MVRTSAEAGGSVTAMTSRPSALRRRRLPPTLARICRNLSIKVVPVSQRRKVRQTIAVKTMERILTDHGPEHLTLVLRSIVETKYNRMELVAPTMLAISDIIIAHPAWAATTNWLDAIDGANLAAMRARARANRRAVQPRAAIATLLFEHLRGTFGQDVCDQDVCGEDDQDF